MCPGNSAHPAGGPASGDKRVSDQHPDAWFHGRMLHRGHARFATPASTESSAAALVLSPNLERAAAAVRTIAFPLPPARGGRSRWRDRDRPDPAVPAPRTCGFAQSGASADWARHDCSCGRARADRAIAMATTHSSARARSVRWRASAFALTGNGPPAPPINGGSPPAAPLPYGPNCQAGGCVTFANPTNRSFIATRA